MLVFHSQAGCIKKWSQERRVPLWSWRSAGLFSPQTLSTITSHQSATQLNWERWSWTAFVLLYNQMRKSSRTLVGSTSVSIIISDRVAYINFTPTYVPCLFSPLLPGYWNIIVYGRKHSYRLYTKMLNEAMRWANAIQGVIDNKVPIETPTQQLIRDIKVTNFLVWLFVVMQLWFTDNWHL